MHETHAEWFAALKRGDVGEVARWLAEEPSLAAARHETGLSSVTWACYCRQDAALAVLLAARPPLDVFEAVAAGESAVAVAALDSDPSLLHASSVDGFTALHLAAFFARPELVALLLARGADAAAVARNEALVQPLHSAVAAGDAASAAALLAAGAAVDALQARGYTALMAAAQQGNEALVSLLLEHGADPLARAEDGRAAADFADERRHHALAARLRASTSPA